MDQAIWFRLKYYLIWQRDDICMRSSVYGTNRSFSGICNWNQLQSDGGYTVENEMILVNGKEGGEAKQHV